MSFLEILVKKKYISFSSFYNFSIAHILKCKYHDIILEAMIFSLEIEKT